VKHLCGDLPISVQDPPREPVDANQLGWFNVQQQIVLQAALSIDFATACELCSDEGQ
jgi:hypothetical protein